MSTNKRHTISSFAAPTAQRYFQKPLAELSTADLAFLAGLPQSPSMFAPTRHMDQALKRRNEVLDRMEVMGALTPEQAAAAKLEPLNLKM